MIGDTRLWASTPFRNRTALLDLAGQIELFHHALAEHVKVAFGVGYPVYALGTPGPQTSEWLGALQNQCSAAAAALRLAQPPDLSSYNLSDEGEWWSWVHQLSQFHRALAIGTGLS